MRILESSKNKNSVKIDDQEPFKKEWLYLFVLMSLLNASIKSDSDKDLSISETVILILKYNSHF